MQSDLFVLVLGALDREGLTQAGRVVRVYGKGAQLLIQAVVLRLDAVSEMY
jgi:hypothetical protein